MRRLKCMRLIMRGYVCVCGVFGGLTNGILAFFVNIPAKRRMPYFFELFFFKEKQ